MKAPRIACESDGKTLKTDDSQPSRDSTQQVVMIHCDTDVIDAFQYKSTLLDLYHALFKVKYK